MKQEFGLVNKLGMVPSGQNPTHINPRLEAEAIRKRESLNVEDAGIMASLSCDGYEFGLMGFENSEPFYLVLEESESSLQSEGLKTLADTIMVEAGISHHKNGANFLFAGDFAGIRLPIDYKPTPTKFVDLVENVNKYEDIRFNGYFKINLFGLSDMLYSSK